jgi:MarR family
MEETTPADVVAALHRFGLERDRFRSALTRALGLPMTDLDALEHLELAGSMTQRELGDRLLLTSGAVTMLVDRLERAGLVIRESHPTDRRVTVVRLLPNPPLPSVPELDDYHATGQRAATSLSADTRRQVVAWLTEVTHKAATETRSLEQRHRS